MKTGLYSFNTDDIVSGFICELLKSTSLPLIDVVEDISKVAYPGLFIESNRVISKSANGATKIISPYNFGDSLKGITFNYTAKSSMYDGTTHYFLGRYLRCLRDLFGVDLMSMYNCFSNEFITDLGVSADKVSKVADNSRYKTLSIPIRLDKTYTIAIDCAEPYFITSLLYGPKGKVNISDKIETLPITQKVMSRFNEPYLYDTSFSDIDITSKARVYANQRYLKLMIQLPASNNSSIVVLEGDYTNIVPTLCSYKNEDGTKTLAEMLSAEDARRIFRAKPKLLEANTSKSYAFSKSLITYLVEQAITSNDTIEKDILRVQQACTQGIDWGNGKGKVNLGSEYYSKDIWNNNLRYYIHSNSISSSYIEDKTDLTGYVDGPVEYLLRNGGY